MPESASVLNHTDQGTPLSRSVFCAGHLSLLGSHHSSTISRPSPLEIHKAIAAAEQLLATALQQELDANKPEAALQEHPVRADCSPSQSRPAPTTPRSLLSGLHQESLGRG